MEGEPGEALYRVVTEEGNHRPANPRLRHADAAISLVLPWAALHDRPIRRACDARNRAGCPATRRPAVLPSGPTMSRRLRTVGVLSLPERTPGRPSALAEPTPARRVDGKPMTVGGRSNDRDARRGWAAGHPARGYKAFVVRGGGVVPDAWTPGPMNRSEPATAQDPVPRLSGGGCLPGDALYDSNPLHAVCDARGFPLLAPRKAPGAGLGHGRHAPGRLRSIALLETPPPGEPGRGGAGRSAFARALYARRSDMERELGGWCSFGGGLAPPPAWVRTPHRVAYWFAAKLLINGVRLCRLRGLAA